MGARLAGALGRIKQLEGQIGGLQEIITNLKAELIEANKEKKILSRKVVKDDNESEGYKGK